jgi:hypothetical protein
VACDQTCTATCTCCVRTVVASSTSARLDDHHCDLSSLTYSCRVLNRHQHHAVGLCSFIAGYMFHDAAGKIPGQLWRAWDSCCSRHSSSRHSSSSSSRSSSSRECVAHSASKFRRLDWAVLCLVLSCACRDPVTHFVPRNWLVKVSTAGPNRDCPYVLLRNKLETTLNVSNACSSERHKPYVLCTRAQVAGCEQHQQRCHFCLCASRSGVFRRPTLAL